MCLDQYITTVKYKFAHQDAGFLFYDSGKYLPNNYKLLRAHAPFLCTRYLPQELGECPGLSMTFDHIFSMYTVCVPICEYIGLVEGMQYFPLVCHTSCITCVEHTVLKDKVCLFVSTYGGICG